MTPVLVSAEPGGQNDASHSGFIDLIDSRQGVRGWAVNHANPLHPVRLQLCIGNRAVAEALAEGERTDISLALGRPARSGFGFEADILQTLPGLMEDPSEAVWVRIAATGHCLPSADGPPTIGRLVTRIQADAVLEQANGTADFPTLVDELRRRAAVLADITPDESPDGLQGYIETIAPGTADQTWFIGWMRRGHLTEFSAALADRRTHPAAVAVLTFLRDDLPEDCCGVVGLIASDWRPGLDTADVRLFFGIGGRFHLRAHTPLRILTDWEIAAEYAVVRERCLGPGRRAALHRLFGLVESWSQMRTQAEGAAAECSVDRILLIPGLGCLVDGWVISPMKRVQGLRLRAGACVMAAEPESLHWKPRADLRSAYPATQRMVDRAGFVGLFSGCVRADDITEPVLKICFEDSTSANWAVSPAVFRLLGFSASVDDARRFFPALEEEAFFPRFARAAIRSERQAIRPPVALSVAQGGPAWVFVLPQESCDLFLLFEELAQQCRTVGGIQAVAFVIASGSIRSDALWLFREFQAVHCGPRGIAASLFAIEDPSHALVQLADILSTLKAAHFVFAGPGVLLRPSGWAQARLALAQATDDIVFLGFEREAAPSASEMAGSPPGASAGCFAWSTQKLTQWTAEAPFFLGGLFRDNGLQQSGSPCVLRHDAAFRTRTSIGTRVTEAVNASVFALCQPAQLADAPRAGAQLALNPLALGPLALGPPALGQPVPALRQAEPATVPRAVRGGRRGRA